MRWLAGLLVLWTHAAAGDVLRSTECNFSIAFPGHAQPTPAASGDGKVVAKAWLYAGPGGRSQWSVLCTRLSEVNPTVERVILDATRGGLVALFQAKLESKHDVTVDGHPGRDFEMHLDSDVDISGPVSGRIRMVLVGNVLYQLCLFHGDDTPISRTRQAAFFDSFALLAPVPPAKVTK